MMHTLSAAALTMAATTLNAAQPPRPAPTPAATPVPTLSTADMDARRAAAARLLDASRFRERQQVTIKDGLRAAEAEMVEDCLNRAAAGASMKTCQAISAHSPTLQARLAASEAVMLDEIMAASQTIYARNFTVAEMDEITRFFKTPVGRRYGALYPQIITDVQARRRVILRRYLTQAASGGSKAQ